MPVIVLLLLFYVMPSFSAAAVKNKDDTVVPKHEVITTKNGVKIYFFESNVPVFEVVFSFHAGADDDPVGKSGLNLAFSQILRRGVKGLDENQINAKLDDNAAGFDANVGEERMSFETYGLNKNAPEILDLFFKILKEPILPRSAFGRLKTNQLEGIAQMPDLAAVLAGHVLDLTLLNGTKKARPIGGFKKDVTTLEASDLRAFYSQAMRLDRLSVLVIGGKSRKDVVDGVVHQIESWPCQLCGQPLPKPQNYSFKNFLQRPGSVILLNRPGISEAHVRMGFLGPSRKSPDYPSLEVAEAILSGPFNSRLNQSVREKQNLSYSVAAGFNYGDDFSTFIFSSSTRNEKVADLILESRKVMSGLVKGDDVTLEEVVSAKSYLQGAFPLMLQNRYTIARMYFSGLLNDLPANFLDEYTKRVGEVTLEGMKVAVKKHFHLDAMQVVVAGDARAIEPRLKKAGIRYVVKNPRDYL